MKRKIIQTLAFIFLPLGLFFTYFAYFLSMPLNLPDGTTFYLKPGTGLHSLTVALTSQGIINHPYLFTLYGHLQENRFKSGEYLLSKNSTPITIWRQITTGTGLYYRHFAIIPGWSFFQLKQALDRTEHISHLTTKWSDKNLMAALGKPDLDPEGEFYPETYYYTRNETDLVILKRAFDLMQNRLNDAWAARASSLPYKNSYELLIAASLIEKEAHLDQERPIISGVLINRLNKNMLLQFDPTVIYGLGPHYTGKISKSDLLADTIYNTYVHHGLPPTPIAMPSQSSLNAAARPQINSFYYFVAKGDGSHHFSASLVEHHAAVASLIKQNVHFNNVSIQQHLQDLLELENAGQVH